ncbi:cell wall-binding repeat-containing protein [Herbiconiux sp. UC225_62]|uniref:cell wall-binding repeat-containing protein n=1 Tax=Herbiconiux sp. UC225_62 TaxID=3350168 RepID=UPI0036D387F1
MRRSLTAIIAALAATALTLAVAAPAAADTLPIQPVFDSHIMVGSLDSLEYRPGEGIIATGWSFSHQEPTETNAPDEFQILFPDGHATWWGSDVGQRTLPRPDVAAAYPEAGPDHGYRLNLGFPGQVGRYQICAEAWFEIVGCGFVDVGPEQISGSVESLTANDTNAFPTLRLKGWLSDSWNSEHNPRVYTITTYGGTSQQGGYYPLVDRPDIRAAHPELPGVVGFDDLISVPKAGPYTICVTVQPQYADPANHSADLGCITGRFGQISPTAAPAFTGDPTVGSTLSYIPPGWDPAPTSDTITWSNGSREPAAGGRDHVLTVADSGHRITVNESVLATGLLGNSAQLTSDTVTLPGVTVERLQGQDRYDVAIVNSQAQFPDAATGAPVVYLASGAKFPDALSAAPAAAQQHGALLLTLPDRLDDRVRAEITRLHPTKVVVIGGPATVSDGVVKTLNALAPTVRIGGADRFAVSRAVIDYAFPQGSSRVFVVTGNNYPDALSTGAAAGSVGAPVLLTNGSAASADAATRSELAKLQAKTVTVVGGPASVSDGVLASLAPAAKVTRLSGPDRFAAAVAVNRATFTSADTVYLATGLNYPDGLSVGARAASTGSPLYLVSGQCVPQDVITDIIADHATKVVVLGGYDSMWFDVEQLYACD